MIRKEPTEQIPHSTNVIRLKLSSLILLCVCLVITTAICIGSLVLGFMQVPFSQPVSPAALSRIPFGQPTPLSAVRPAANPPWGELVKLDLEVEQPDEYVAF
jgi:hypothetical protein